MPLQGKIGWRSSAGASGSTTTVSSLLLDTYSGAAAAYSLRRLRTAYTGSAIRVRRSSDNTELNIGFDSNGNLDTVALSAFVGTGNGFVTTWYDQSGNDRNVTQTTADNQPRIVSGGIIDVLSNKPSIYFDGSNDCLDRTDTGMPTLGTTVLHISKYNSSSVGQAFVVNWGQGSSAKAFYNMYFNTGLGLSNYGESFFVGGRLNTNNLTIITKPNAAGYQTWRMYINSTNTGSGSMNSQTALLNSSGGFRIGRVNPSQANTYAMLGYISELVIWPSDLNTQRTSLEENANAYYSVYPNPTSVWNLLAAAYNADTTGSSSLKTSLVASYNGESNTNDSFGSNNGTAVGGLTYGTGKIGNAFNLNGTTSYIEVGDKLDLGLSSWSYSIWFYPTNLGFNRTLFSKTAWAAGGGRIVLNIESALITFTLTLSDGNHILIRDNSTVLPGSQWINLTVVVDRNDKIKLYYNGVLSTNVVNLGSVNNNLIPYINDNLNNTRPFRIGCGSGTDGYNPETPTRFAQGSIDAFNVWNRALTQSEITELYNSGNGAQYITNDFYKPTTNDALGTNNGTAQGGLTYEVGKVGTAFKFNGTNAYVELGDVMDLGLSSWSYGMWFKSAVASSGTLFSKSIAAGLAGRFAAYIDSNRINFIFDYNSPLNSAGNTVNIGTSNTIVTNTWYHLVCVFDRTSNIRLYLNGVLQSVTTSYGVNDLSQYGAANTNYNTSCPFRIGAYTAADNINAVSFFNGSIDAFNVWNRVLTASEITELYNSGNGKQYPN